VFVGCSERMESRFDAAPTMADPVRSAQKVSHLLETLSNGTFNVSK
jgi:hypothetical protein